MKKKSLRLILSVLAILLYTTNANAGMWDDFFASVTSRGTEPTVKTFYLQPHESMEGVDYLEFQEYANSLKLRLKELGYIETNKENAFLLIKLGYYIGQKEVISTTSSSSSSSISYGRTNINSMKSTNSKASGSVVGFSDMAIASSSGSSSSNSKTQINNQVFSYGDSSTTTKIENGIPCFLRLEAIEMKSNIPQWTLDMEVIIDQISRFPNIFPWMCLVSKWYIGHSFSGIVEINNTKKKCFKLYNLPQHFDRDYWRLQIEYFGLPNAYIKKDPMPLVQ